MVRRLASCCLLPAVTAFKTTQILELHPWARWLTHIASFTKEYIGYWALLCRRPGVKVPKKEFPLSKKRRGQKKGYYIERLYWWKIWDERNTTQKIKISTNFEMEVAGNGTQEMEKFTSLGLDACPPPWPMVCSGQWGHALWLRSARWVDRDLIECGKFKMTSSASVSITYSNLPVFKNRQIQHMI